jgi:hypothetical protein
MERAAKIYSKALTACNGPNVLDETRLLLLLRFAESLAIVGNLERRSVSSVYFPSDDVLSSTYHESMELYNEASALMDTLDWEDKARVTAIRVKGRARKLAFTAIAKLSFALIQNARVRWVLSGRSVAHHLVGKCLSCCRSCTSEFTPVDPRIGHLEKTARDRRTLIGQPLPDERDEVSSRFDQRPGRFNSYQKIQQYGPIPMELRPWAYRCSAILGSTLFPSRFSA